MKGRWFSGRNAYSESVPAIFLPAASSGGSNSDYFGRYWSSTVYYNDDAYDLIFGSSGVGMSDDNGSKMNSVRCVKD